MRTKKLNAIACVLEIVEAYCSWSGVPDVEHLICLLVVCVKPFCRRNKLMLALLVQFLPIEAQLAFLDDLADTLKMVHFQRLPLNIAALLVVDCLLPICAESTGENMEFVVTSPSSETYVQRASQMQKCSTEIKGEGVVIEVGGFS